jgi:hypothetical protein
MNRSKWISIAWILLSIQLTLMGWLLPLVALVGSPGPWKWLGMVVILGYFGLCLFSPSLNKASQAEPPRTRPYRAVP